MSGAWRDGEAASFRRLIRDAVRKGPFTRAERDITLATVNHWIYHASHGAQYMHPGRAKIGKKAQASEASVKRLFSRLRRASVLWAQAHIRGGRGKATEYTVDLIALLKFCGCEIPEAAEGYLQRLSGGHKPGQKEGHDDPLSHPHKPGQDDPPLKGRTRTARSTAEYNGLRQRPVFDAGEAEPAGFAEKKGCA